MPGKRKKQGSEATAWHTGRLFVRQSPALETTMFIACGEAPESPDATSPKVEYSVMNKSSLHSHRHMHTGGAPQSHTRCTVAGRGIGAPAVHCRGLAGFAFHPILKMRSWPVSPRCAGWVYHCRGRTRFASPGIPLVYPWGVLSPHAEEDHLDKRHLVLL